MDWYNILKNGVYLCIIDSDDKFDDSRTSRFKLQNLLRKNDETFLYVLKELVDQNDQAQLFDFFVYICTSGSYEQMIKVANFVDCRLNNDAAFIAICMTCRDEPIKTQFFINLGVDVNAQDGKALEYAILNYLLDIARLLLENGAIITDAVKKAFIRYHNYPEMWDLLYEFGMEPHNIVTPDILLAKEQINVIRTMRKNGVDFNLFMDRIKDR
jgi:hypothetical protein